MRQRYPQYINSSKECLEEIPAHWQTSTLGRLGKFLKGNGGTKEDEVEDGIPCVRYGDIYTQHQYLIRETRSGISKDSLAKYTPMHYGDILFAGSGETIEEIGKSAANLIKEPAYCGGDVIVLRPTIQSDATFFGYAADCLTSTYQKARMGRGVTVMHIYSSELKNLVIPLPPLDEQSTIAAFLDRETARIDQLIVKHELLIERLAEYRNAVITRAVTKGLPTDAARDAGLNPEPRMKPSGSAWIGEVPEHWTAVPLKHVATYSTSTVDKKSQEDEIRVRLCNYTDVYYQDRINADGEFMEATASSNEHAKFKLLEGDTVITKDSEDWRDIAVPAIIEKTANDFVCGYHLGIIRPNPEMDPTFMFWAIKATTTNQQMQVASSGVTRYGLPNPAVREAVQAIPPAAEQRAIAEYLDQKTARVDALSERAATAIERLNEYRTALITAAVTGKIDVRESGAAEEHTE